MERGEAAVLTRQRSTFKPRVAIRPIGSFALLVSLGVSALLSAVALDSGEIPWVGVFSLLPVLRVVQRLNPADATRAGGYWGALLYIFTTSTAFNVIDPGLKALVLLVCVPAIFAGIGAWVTRRTCFSPLLLGIGWALVELALTPLNLSHGLIAPSAESVIGGTLGQVFGFATVAFLVALCSAVLLGVITSLSVSLAAFFHAKSIAVPCRSLWLSVERIISFEHPTFSHPRAPPVKA